MNPVGERIMSCPLVSNTLVKSTWSIILLGLRPRAKVAKVFMSHCPWAVRAVRKYSAEFELISSYNQQSFT